MDNEPYIIFGTQIMDESKISYQVEIHYSNDFKQSMKACILTNAEIYVLVAKYGCKL